jgi:syntaxin 7
MKLDNIEENVASMAQNTKAASRELTSASRYQKGARKRACYLMLIPCVILTIVLLAVTFPCHLVANLQALS